jgi:NAD(P)-dependent dehydrogenase (short-subunit alcohol dehydrogenase family)
MTAMARNGKPVALVTGATSGIGREGAVWLARDGFHVVAGGRNAERGAAVVAAIEAEGGSAGFAAFDITSEADWARVTDAIAAQHGRLDALVNCGGAFFSKPLLETSLAEFRGLWETDVESVVLGTKYGLRTMGATRSAGSIVNVSSLAGLIGLEDCAAYCAAKAAVTHFSRIAAVEGGSFDPPIRVNSLNPGVIYTEMITGAYGDNEGVKAFVKDGNALDMLGEARHIAAAIRFLASGRSRMVTGTAHVVDGGRGSD